MGIEDALNVAPLAPTLDFPCIPGKNAPQAPSESLEAPVCRQRLESALDSYHENITHILSALAEAAPEATIVFLQAYNPFSLGTGIDFEEGSNLMVDRLNNLKGRLTVRYGRVRLSSTITGRISPDRKRMAFRTDGVGGYWTFDGARTADGKWLEGKFNTVGSFGFLKGPEGTFSLRKLGRKEGK